MWDLSSLTRDGTCVPCIVRQILYHWTAREVPGASWLLLLTFYPLLASTTSFTLYTRDLGVLPDTTLLLTLASSAHHQILTYLQPNITRIHLPLSVSTTLHPSSLSYESPLDDFNIFPTNLPHLLALLQSFPHN